MASSPDSKQSVHVDCKIRQRPKTSTVSNESSDESQGADAKLVVEFGYKPILKREFGHFSTFSFAVSISGLFSSIMSTFSYPLASGGASSVIWCWFISGIGCMCLACSVAELVSAYPTSGGLITGWLNLLGQVTGLASVEYGSAQILLAAFSMAQNYDFEITINLTIAVMAVLLVFCGLINSLSTYWMEKMTKIYVIFHMCVLFSCAILLLVQTKDKHTAEYVFTHTESKTGWTPPGLSFLFGFLSVSWTMTDYDATAHIAEEIDEPEVKAPWAISLAMLFTYLAGFFFNIVLCFCMGDPSEILGSPIMQPVAQIFLNRLGKSGGIFYTICGFIILQFVCFTTMQSTSRTIFAFSRDKLLPFSQVWLSVNRWTGTPLNAVWLTVVSCILVNLIGLGSSIAIAGVFDVCAISLDLSYCIPIFCKLFYGKFEPGPWHMGKFSWWVNVWALIWTIFVSFIFLLPSVRPITAQNVCFNHLLHIIVEADQVIFFR
ncbi:hypothetical protein EPUL_005231 [Erysiphe pulchra]|uniref:Amino acid transporter n=1 Tax=Erysiphe pulchra TaxID=225359 RepID=A0A2S4PMA1_9PEZI|nr:hypothetical protein EPUL_005231 [Erysiphe pulchra]